MTQIPRAGVIGNPISHSLSPKLHGHWLRHYAIAGQYDAIHVTEDALQDTLRRLPAQGYVGINVTLPHKVAVLALADQWTDRATLIGAANTLTFKSDGRIFADNTDGYGFLENLRQGAPAWQPALGPAMVFGAGGAARAVIVALLEAGVPEIILTNRTRAKAETLRLDFGARVRVVDWVQAPHHLGDATTVVNTTSLGMTGAQEFRLSLDALDPRATVTDIVYNPLMTPFLTAAAAKGCTIVDGLGMLLHQGVPGFERWFGTRPQVDADTRRAVLS